MAVSSFIASLAKYEPAINANIAYVLALFYSAVMFICMIIMFSYTPTPQYAVQATFPAVFSILTAVVKLITHEFPSKVGPVVVVIVSITTGLLCIPLYKIMDGERDTCSSLYKNTAAMDALSSRLDELGSATGSVVHVDLLNAEATQPISHNSMLCMKLYYSTGWYTTHMGVIYAVGIIAMLCAVTTMAMTFINWDGAKKWLINHAIALKHLMGKEEHALSSEITAGIKHLEGHLTHHHHHKVK